MEEEHNNNRFMRKSLEVLDEGPKENNRPIRLHVKKIKKRRPVFDEWVTFIFIWVLLTFMWKVPHTAAVNAE